jgi:hypothetical protein
LEGLIVNADSPAGSQDQVLGSVSGPDPSGVAGVAAPSPSPSPAPAPTTEWDAAARAAHYAAGGYSVAAVQALAAPSAPLQPATWQDWAYYLKNALKAGREPAELFGEMQARGCPQQPSYTLMREVVDGLAHSAQQEMVTGAGLVALGVVITVVTYNFASSGGGTYIMMWGPIVFGGFILLRGIWNWLRVPRY